MQTVVLILPIAYHRFLETVAQRCSVKKVFLEILQNLKEKDSLFLKKRDCGTGVFLLILRNFKEHFFL